MLSNYNRIQLEQDDLNVIQAKLDAIATQVKAGEVSQEEFNQELSKLTDSQKTALEIAAGKPLSKW